MKKTKLSSGGSGLGRWAVIVFMLAGGCGSAGGTARDGGGSGGVAGDAGTGGTGGTGGSSSGAGGTSADKPCGDLLKCCATPGFPDNNEGPCFISSSRLQRSTCQAYLTGWAPGGVCVTDPTGAPPTVACGTTCTKLAGCCSKLAAATMAANANEAPADLIPGCTALGTNCTAASERLCQQFLNDVSYLITCP